MVGHDAPTPETIRESVVNVNGELVPGPEASVPVLDRSVLYGDAVYDSLPVVDGKALLVDRHVDRLFDALRGVKIPPPADEAEFTDEILRTAAASDLTDGSVRTIVSRGTGPAGIANTDDLEGPTVLVVPQHVPGMAAAHRDLSTRRAIVAATRTVPHDTVDPRIKSCNYLPNALAERETVGTDADSAVMLDHEGYVAEVYDANVVVLDREGVLRTPPRTQSLGGITREVLLEQARDTGHEVAESDLTPYDLRTARDVLMTSSAHGVARITHLEGEQVGGEVPSQVVSDLVDRYWEYVTSQEYVSVGE